MKAIRVLSTMKKAFVLAVSFGLPIPLEVVATPLGDCGICLKRMNTEADGRNVPIVLHTKGSPVKWISARRSGPRHIFHAGCIRSWLHQKGEKAPCPLCKVPMTEADSPLLYKKELTTAEHGARFCSALMDGSKKTIETMLATYKDIVFWKDKQGMTPLMYVAYSGRIGCIDLLLKHVPIDEQKNYINRADKAGRTALMYAALGDHCNMLKLLCQRGAMVDKRDKCGESAVFYAVRSNSFSCIDWLLLFEASADIKNNQGQTALQLAKQLPRCRQEILERLIFAV